MFCNVFLGPQGPLGMPSLVRKPLQWCFIINSIKGWVSEGIVEVERLQDRVNKKQCAFGKLEGRVLFIRKPLYPRLRSIHCAKLPGN